MVTEGNERNSFHLLLPPQFNTSFILKAFEELQRQWCPPRQYKKFFVLNYNDHPLSEEILTAILKLNEPPRLIFNRADDFSYYTYETRRCALVMFSGYEKMRPNPQPQHYGSRYFIFIPNLEESSLLLEQFHSGKSVILDRAYYLVYDYTSLDIQHHNFFTKRTIHLDPLDIRVPDDLKNLNGRKLRIQLPVGNEKVTTFEIYLMDTIARQRNGSYLLTPFDQRNADYCIVNFGTQFLGNDKVLALGNTFVSVFVPRSKPKPIISVLIDPFDYYTWILLFVMIFMLAAVLTLFGRVLSRFNFVENVVEILMVILGGPTRTYGGWFENQIINIYCLLMIVIVSSYQSLIISYLTHVRYFPEINTLEEIRKSCVFPHSSLYAEEFDLLVDGDIDDERENMCFMMNSRDDKHITTLLVERKRFLDKAAQQAYSRQLRVADTVLNKYYQLYYFPSKSIMRELLPFYIHAFRESGLYEQYYRNKSYFAPAYKQQPFDVRSFAVADMVIIWYLYFSGVVASTVWFLFEVLFYHCSLVKRLKKTFNRMKNRPKNRHLFPSLHMISVLEILISI
uniref:Ionotropic glutamate receptor C-terminal domain-containing protein n=1 Tax=Anopheles epiroticus TaxID=199890 RepID=A0A182PU16_9DIPT